MATNQRNDEQEEKFYTKLGIPVATINDAKAVIDANAHTQLVTCLIGDAGIGKTHLVRQVAARRKTKKPFTWHGKEWVDEVPVIVWYLAHWQAEDTGVPYPSRAKRNELLRESELFMKMLSILPPEERYTKLRRESLEHAITIAEHVLQSGSPLEDGTFEFLIEKSLKDLPPEAILFLDEWNRADKAVIKSFFTLLEDRELHGIKIIPPGVQIVAAMNPSDGAYSVNEAEKDHAFRRRMAFLAIVVNSGAWLKYAAGVFHPLVVEFIRASPDDLYDFRLRNAGKTFPCPATWEKVSQVLQAAEKNKTPLISPGVTLSIQGFIGEGTGARFKNYVLDNETLVSPSEVLQEYSTHSGKLRKRIKHLVQHARNDVLGEVIGAVAITLFSEQPPVKDVSPNLALFLDDLPPEIATTFITIKLSSAMVGIPNAETYLTELSTELCSYPSYIKLYNKLGDINSAVKAELGEKSLDLKAAS